MAAEGYVPDYSWVESIDERVAWSLCLKLQFSLVNGAFKD